METNQQTANVKCRRDQNSANPLLTTAVIDANWQRLTARGPGKTLTLLKRKFPHFRLYQCSGPGFTNATRTVTARGVVGRVIIEPYNSVEKAIQTISNATISAQMLTDNKTNKQEASGIACGPSLTV